MCLHQKHTTTDALLHRPHAKYTRHRTVHSLLGRTAVTFSLLLTAASASLQAAGNPVPTSSDFYVSPTGNDANAGDGSAPLATIGKAKELAALWIHQVDGGGAFINNQATIYLKDGTHKLVSPAANPLAPGLEITSADTRPGARITFRNAPDATAVINGALEFVADNTADTGTWQTVQIQAYNGGNATNSTFVGYTTVNVQKFVFSGALRAELAARIAALRAARVNGTAFCFTELYFNGERKVRARHPNKRAIPVNTETFTFATPTPHINFDQRWFEQTPGGVTTDLDAADLYDSGKTEVIFTHNWQWVRALITDAVVVHPIYSGLTTTRTKAHLGALENPGGIYNESGRLGDVANVSSISGSASGEPNWDRLRFENNKKFVDLADEWYFDDDEIALYFLPNATDAPLLTTAKFQIPVTYRLISVTGTEANPATGVEFIGDGTGDFDKTSTYRLQFEMSAWKYDNNRGNSEYYSARHAGYTQLGAIDGIYLDGFKLAYCKLSRFGAAGVSLGGNRLWAKGQDDRNDYDHQPRGSTKNVIIDNNWITDGGGIGIRVDHYPRMTTPLGFAEPDNNQITSNWVTSLSGLYTATGGVIPFASATFGDASGITVPHGINTLITDNSIDDMPFVGITTGWGCFRTTDENIQIRRNGVVRTMRKMADGGAIYTGGGRGTTIANNTIWYTACDNWTVGRDVDAVAAGNPSPPILVDLYFDLTSQLFTVSSNGMPATMTLSKIKYDRNSHTFTNQTGTLYYTPGVATSIDCTMDTENGTGGCCGTP